MGSKNRTFTIVTALVTALVMLFSLTGAAFGGATAPVKGTVCVDGFVINHRELAVDGTKTTPPLVMEAIDATGQSFSVPVDSNGYYKFDMLTAGNWNFKMQLPPEWDGIVPVAAVGGVAETGLTTLDESTTCYRIVFKIRRLFNVTVLKWEELLDASVQAGPDWEITMTPVKDPFVKLQTDVTDAGGRVAFTVTPGNWIVSEKIKAGWTPVTPAQVKLFLDQYAAGGALDPVIFKNLEPPCQSKIVVEKFGFGRDDKGNEVQLGPLAGWKVTVARADNTMPPITKVTDGFGKATFEKLLPGVYKVSEVVQSGWELMENIDNPQTVTHMACEETTVTFKNREFKGDLRIYGKKWFKAWVPPFKGSMVGLSGWEITAGLVGTDVMTTTLTNALGDYEFTAAQLADANIGFPGASVEVCEEDRDNWIHVTPACVTVKFPYPAPASFTGIKVNFTNKQDPPTDLGVYDPGVPDTSAAGGCRASYQVQPGDTLARIAARQGSSIGAIASASGVRNPNLLRTGQTLCIP